MLFSCNNKKSKLLIQKSQLCPPYWIVTKEVLPSGILPGALNIITTKSVTLSSLLLVMTEFSPGHKDSSFLLHQHCCSQNNFSQIGEYCNILIMDPFGFEMLRLTFLQSLCGHKEKIY